MSDARRRHVQFAADADASSYAMPRLRRFSPDAAISALPSMLFFAADCRYAATRTMSIFR
jgi:hypothetical protein